MSDELKECKARLAAIEILVEIVRRSGFIFRTTTAISYGRIWVCYSLFENKWQVEEEEYINPVMTNYRELGEFDADMFDWEPWLENVEKIIGYRIGIRTSKDLAL